MTHVHGGHGRCVSVCCETRTPETVTGVDCCKSTVRAQCTYGAVSCRDVALMCADLCVREMFRVCCLASESVGTGGAVSCLCILYRTYVHSVAQCYTQSVTRSTNVLSFFPREASQHRFVSSSTRRRDAPPIANTAYNLRLELLQSSRGTLGAERCLRTVCCGSG